MMQSGVMYLSGRHAAAAAAATPVRGSLCPFLFHTKTLCGQQSNSQQRRTIAIKQPDSREATPRHGSSDDNPSPESGAPPSFLKQKAARVASNRSRGSGSSITPAEQAAFDNIWAMFNQSSPTTAKAKATSSNHGDTNYKNILELFAASPDPAAASHPDNVSIRESPSQPEEIEPVQDIKTGTIDAFDIDPSSDASTRLTRENAMAEIQGFLRSTTPSLSSAPDKVSPDRIQSSALNLVEDVADSLTTALDSTTKRPDIAMWEVAEQKIFPLIRLLRPSSTSLSSPPPDDPASSTTTTTTTTNTDNPQPQPQAHPLIPSDLPILPILSQAYPSATLLILRLYAAHHPTSPLLLALLPRLKSSGPTSYVLGAHTHFYNTLLSVYWTIYSDLRGMNGLLAEMDANGVDFDVGTCEVLEQVGRDRRADLEDRGEGARGKGWWERSEQRVWWPTVGVEWKVAVERRLEERGLSTGRVMREEEGGLSFSSRRDNHYDEDHDDDEMARSEYVVTL